MIHDDIIQMVADNHKGVTVEDLKSPSNRRIFVTPRHIAMVLIRKYTNYSMQEIVKLFNRTNHTTVINAQEKVAGYIEIYKEYAAKFELLENMAKLIVGQFKVYISYGEKYDKMLRPAYFQAIERLLNEGYFIVNNIIVNNKLLHGDTIETDIPEIINCDTLAVMNNWKKSKKVCTEVNLANSLGKKVINTDTMQYLNIIQRI